MKAYLRSNQQQLDWQKFNVGDIGYRLVEQGEKQYVGKQVAAWDVDLSPRDRHFDKRTTITTPLAKAGAYLVTATMADGNTSRIVLWIADTAIVKKPMANRTYYYVADAVTGEPLPGVNVELFGYHMKPAGRNKTQVETSNTTYHSDATGQVFVDTPANRNDYAWLVTAKTGAGRLAFLGFNNAWHGNYDDQQYNATKSLRLPIGPSIVRSIGEIQILDPPVQYDADGSSFAGQTFKLQIMNPRGDKVAERGNGRRIRRHRRRISIAGRRHARRVPIADRESRWRQLPRRGVQEAGIRSQTRCAENDPYAGRKDHSHGQSQLLFRRAVTRAKVRYKVLRTNYNQPWFPVGAWDWFYGPGYWWFASDYAWYPGWRTWGCRRPIQSWWPVRQQPPEVVAEAEVAIGPDGTISIEIDTALAKELHGNADQEYRSRPKWSTIAPHDRRFGQSACSPQTISSLRMGRSGLLSHRGHDSGQFLGAHARSPTGQRDRQTDALQSDV